MDKFRSVQYLKAEGIWIIGAMVLATLAPSSVFAHAFPSASQPAVGATVNSPPAQVVITFDSPIEPLFASLQVLDSQGANQVDGEAQVGGDRRMLSAKLKPLKPGDFTVKWTVVAEDGHRTEGSYAFTVGGSGS